MKKSQIYTGKISHTRGENINLADIMLNNKELSFSDRIDTFNRMMNDLLRSKDKPIYFRTIASAADREVTVINNKGQPQKMLMFGSNNYLGLANHPYVKEKVKKAIDLYGVGIGGPALLNGYSSLMRTLEERIAALKGAEDALIFTSGYNANVGLVNGLCKSNDLILADEYSHASFFDGIKMLHGKCFTFEHNNLTALENQIKKYFTPDFRNLFIAVEGVYSMDGDIAPLDRLGPLCKKYNALLLLDDAHATGVLGASGSGTHEHFHLPVGEDIILGTFSKTFAVNGGFIAASKPVIHYLRYMARSYMFSAALPPVTIAAVLAGLDVMKNEPHLLQRLHDNVAYATRQLRRFGFTLEPQSAILALKVPPQANIRKMALQFHRAGIFINAIEFPAVPLNQQRFRISIMASHTREDIDQLVAAADKIWYDETSM